jgi:hypothetical protein
VEGLLKTVGKQRASQSGRSDGAWTEDSSPGAFGAAASRPDRLQGSPRDGAMPWIPLSPTETPASGDHDQPGALLGLGQFERLPPFEMIEELYVPCWSSTWVRPVTDNASVATHYSLQLSSISCPSYTRATTCGRFTPHHTCAPPCAFSMPSGPPLQTDTPSMAATTMHCTAVPGSIWRPMSSRLDTHRHHFRLSSTNIGPGGWRTLHHRRACPGLGPRGGRRGPLPEVYQGVHEFRQVCPAGWHDGPPPTRQFAPRRGGAHGSHDCPGPKLG